MPTTPILTAADFSNNMILFARMQDPSGSFEVGTPERKIIDTVAQELSITQIGNTSNANALNLNSKIGSSLDQFTSLLGMDRQQAVAGSGFVQFSRPSPAPTNITIPSGTTVQATNVNVNTPTTVQFSTISAGSIAQGATTSELIPIQAVTTGAATNIPAGAIDTIVGTVPSGVSAVTNPGAVTTGQDAEDDDQLKTRFQNTWARNLSGTSSSYLALALAGAYTTKAICLGNQSVYQEYIQVPNADDNGQVLVNGALTNLTYTDVDGIGNVLSTTGGQSGQWTSALSEIPYAKQIFTTTPVFISDSDNFYYQQDVDFSFNPTPYISGDALRSTLTVSTAAAALTTSTLAVTSTEGFDESGAIFVYGSDGAFHILTYTGLTTTSFTGCVLIGASVNSVVNGPVYQLVNGPTMPQVNRPNFTFLNVYQGTDDSVQVLTPGEVVLSEYRYVSTSSRNDLDHNVNNAVDVYVNGSNPQQVDTIFIPTVITNNFQFTANTSSPWYVENFRRDGEPNQRPLIGNLFTPLFNPPILSLPSSIQVTSDAGTFNFFLGVHYWLVHETDNLRGSIRARDGIEWLGSLWGDTSSTPPASLEAPYSPTSASGTTNSDQNIITYSNILNPVPISVSGYTSDANIVAVQSSYDTNKPSTVDVLAHRMTNRYFKFDLTLTYTANSSPSSVNPAIQSAIQSYLNNQYYGAVLQLSNILEAVSSTSGVQNVRWTNDLPVPPSLVRVWETDINGNALAGASIQRIQYGQTSGVSGSTINLVEQEALYITGNNFGTSDYCTLTWNDTNLAKTASVNLTLNSMITGSTSATASYIQTAINAAIEPMGGVYASGVTVTSTYISPDAANPFQYFTITYNATSGQPFLPTITNSITQGAYTYDEDFILLDDELPNLPAQATASDTGGVAGLILHRRAENTFYRPGVA